MLLSITVITKQLCLTMFIGNVLKKIKQVSKHIFKERNYCAYYVHYFRRKRLDIFICGRCRSGLWFY